jgi:large subunit ribosomal protein L3
MIKQGILGKKVGMTQIFDDKGNRVPVTVIKAGPNVVLDVKTSDKHGYTAVQLGFDDQREQRINKPDLGKFLKVDVTPKKFIKEIRVDEIPEDYKAGKELTVSDVFKVGDPIDVTGYSKGKGFQGVIKRYHFSSSVSTHGTHEFFRHGGSVGTSLDPSRIIKGQKMPGRMGNKKVTIQNLKIAAIDKDENLIMVRGSVPGHQNGYLVIRYAAKKRVYI